MHLEPKEILIIVVLAGLLVWRLQVAWRPLLLRQTEELLRSSFFVLRRVRWILFVFLIGYAAGAVVTETSWAIHHKDALKATTNSAQAYAGALPWAYLLRKALLAAWRQLPGSLEFTAFQGMGLWMLVLIGIWFRRQIRRSLFGPDPLTGQRMKLWLVLWLCVFIGLVPFLPLVVTKAVSFAGALSSHDGHAETPTWLFELWMLMWIALGILTTCCSVCAYSFLGYGIIQAAQRANAGDEPKIGSLLSVDGSGFLELVKANLIFVFGPLIIMELCSLWLFNLLAPVRVPSWLFDVSERVVGYFFIPLRIGLALIPLMVVIGRTDVGKARHVTGKLWRRHWPSLIALMLPLLLVKFVLELIGLASNQLFYQQPLLHQCLRVATGLIFSATLALWLVAMARLLGQLNAAAQTEPCTPDATPEQS